MIGADDPALAERMLGLAAAAGAEQIDVMVTSSVSNAVGVAGGALEEAERAERREIGLRVIVGQRQACVSASDDREATLAEMAERAVAMAAAAPEDKWCGLAPTELLGEPVNTAGLELEDPADYPDAAVLEDQALTLEAAALAVDGVSQVEQASASWSRESVTIHQSNGFAGGYRRSSIGLACSAIAGSGLGRERDYAFELRRYSADLPPLEDIGRLAGTRAVERLKPQKPPSGRYPVVYDERVAGGLIGHVLSAANGNSIARGSSWLADAMETRILPAGFDIVEDPLVPRGRASRPFDAEGLPARRGAVVQDGTLVRWLLDLSTARQLGLESTANARRSVAGVPSPGATNIRVTSGERDRAALLADMGTGLLITSMIGASINPNTGAYSRGCSGFWIENGQIAWPVNEATVAGSLPEMVLGLVPANDADPAKAIAAPSLLVEGVSIGA